MRLLLPLTLACLLAVQAASARHLLQNPDQTLGRQFVQFGVTVPGRCSEVTSLPEQIIIALQADVQKLLDDGYPGQDIKALIPRIDRPAFCTDVKSREPGDTADYAAIQAIVRLQTGDNPNTPPPDNAVQLQAVRLLNRGWNECSADYADNTFSSIADALSDAGKTAVINRATRQQSGNRIRTTQLQPCVGTNPPTPPSSPSPPVSPSPPPASPSPPPESPSPPASPSPPPGPATCGNTGNGQPFVCAAPFVSKPNNQNISNPSTTACCACPSQSNVKAIDVNGVLVGCLSPFSPCPSNFPITIRPVAGSEPVACLARGPTTVCPPGFTFPFYATIGGEAVLTNCWSDTVLGNSGICQVNVGSGPPGTTGLYNIPLRSNTTTAPVGCVLSGATSCPASHPFAQYGASGITACFAVPPLCSTLSNTVPLYSADTFVGCGQLTGLNCPSAFPIEVSNRFDEPPVQCYATNMACSFSAVYQFSLYSGNTLVRCVQPIPGVSTCTAANFGAFSGVELYSVTASVGFTGCADTPNSCPSSFPVFFRDGSDSLERCSASIFGICEQQFNGQYLTNVLSTPGGAIIGCRRGGSCGIDDVIVSGTVTGDATECLDSSTTICPQGKFPLYSGSVGNVANGVAKLVRCINAVTTTSCDNLGMFTSEVFGSDDGSGNVVGCMRPDLTPCPSASPFAVLSDAGTVTSCQTGGFCGSTSTKLVSAAGAAIGCITPASSFCPRGADTSAYNLPFFLRGFPSGAAAMVECRAEPDPSPPNCNDFLDYPIEVFAVSDISSTNRLTGCLRSGQVCPPNFPFGIFNGGVLQQCRSGGDSGCPGSIPLRSGTTGEVLGCLAPGTVSCTNPNFQFPIWDASGRVAACLSPPDFDETPDCDALMVVTEISSNIEVQSSNGPLSQSNWVGCTTEVSCPDNYNVFVADESGDITTCLADDASCVQSQVPIIDSPSALDTTPLAGCMTREEGSDARGQQCPFTVFGGPSAQPQYNFPLIDSNRTLIACFRSNGADNTCDPSSVPPSLIAFYEQEGDVNEPLPASPVACMVAENPRQTSCPSGDINGQDTTYDFRLFGSNGTAGAQAVLYACVATAGTPDANTNCSGPGTIGSQTVYPVEVHDSVLTDSGLGQLIACTAAEVACPVVAGFNIWVADDLVDGQLGQATLERCITGAGSASGAAACDASTAGGGFSTAGVVVLDRTNVPTGPAAFPVTDDPNFVGCVTTETDARGCPAAYPAPLGAAVVSGPFVVRACQKTPTACAISTTPTDFRQRILQSTDSSVAVTLGCTSGALPLNCDAWVGVNFIGFDVRDLACQQQA